MEVVDRLKTQLKRALRKHVAEAVNGVCDDLGDELTQAPPLKVGASAFESDYECCRRLVEYMARNMDTSPSFAQQMDCVILAYQSSASTEILNSVVTEDLWVRRKARGSRQDGAKELSDSVAEHSEVKAEKKVVRAVKSSQSAVMSVQRDSNKKGEAKTAPPKVAVESRTKRLQTAKRVEKPRVAELSDTQADPKNATRRASKPPMPSLSASRPRQWAKRKRLSTKSRSRSTSQPTKRSRNQSSRAKQTAEESSTEQDSEDNSCQPARANERVESVSTAAGDITKDVNANSQKDKNEVNVDSQEQNTVALKSIVNIGDGDAEQAQSEPTVKKVEKQDGGNDAHVGLENQLERGRLRDEVLVNAQYRQMQRDLESADDSFVLAIAKARFQAMLNDVVNLSAGGSDSDESKQDNSSENLILKLCDANQRSPDEKRLFKTRLRDTIAIVDALLCSPPPDRVCSRNCKNVRSQMCNEFERCINPMCGIWHDAETHSSNCPNPRCEFNARIMLRETMHLIEQKQQAISEARDALAQLKLSLLAATTGNKRGRVSKADAATEVAKLEEDLQSMNGDLIVLNDTKQYHQKALQGIGVDSHTDEGDGFPDFASHYAAKVPKYQES